VPIELVGPEEVRRHWPAAKVDDILTAAWVPDEGRANPADVTQAYAKGARMGGAQIVEGVTVTGFVTAGGRVTGVETDRGSIETETVVIAAGMGPSARRTGGRHGAPAGRGALLPVDRHG
jgi:4-methylaminobutanoate oxidase (formaldehyde-forming)